MTLRVVVAAWILLIAAAPADARRHWRRFIATAYTVDGTTASGRRTRDGRTAAADPHVLPFGTKIEISGAGPYSGVYTIEDSGPAMSGRRIDIFIEDSAEARRFGRKRVKVRVIQRAPAATGRK